VHESRLVDVLVPREVRVPEDPYVITQEAFAHPVDGNSLDDLVKKGDTAVIIADDYTRPTPAGPISRAILDKLNSLGVDDSHIMIIIASGLHRPMREAELSAKLGRDVVRRVELVCHDAWDDSQNEEVGRTSRGTPVWINRRVLKADLRIAIGLITGHFTAGYGGGPKTILPGVSGYRTIFHNHANLQSSSSARIGLTEGNPAWEDALEVLRFLGPTLAVNVVLNMKNELVGAFYGKPAAAQNAGMGLYHSIYAFKVKEKADIIIASTNPEYMYLDQCLKTLVPASMFVRDQGVRIIASPCNEHLGPPYLRELYYDSLIPRWPDAEEYEERMRAGKFKDVGDAVGILKLLQSNNSDVFFVSDPSFEQELVALGFTYRNSVQEALTDATQKLGEESSVLVVPYGPMTLPIT
jgi:nickel-dependent lactate racemase